MALPASPNSISLSQVNTELGLTSTAQISMNDSAVRTLFGKASGAIAMSDGHGKSNSFAFTISTNQSDANLRTLAVAAGWNQATLVVATIASGVEIKSTSTSNAALTINGSFPAGVQLINGGTIVGKGGAGGSGGWQNGAFSESQGQAGFTGGTGLAASVAVSITNNSIISGGGGGGGGNGLYVNPYCTQYGGTGGGGGNGYGAGGYRGGGDINGSFGTAGGQLTGGSGGGAGGSNAASGSNGSAGGGAWWQTGGAGGSGGAAVTGNSNITWVATGTRYGAIS